MPPDVRVEPHGQVRSPCLELWVRRCRSGDFDIDMFVWPVFLGFLIWGIVVVRREIRDVEGPDRDRVKGPGLKEGWARATGVERAAFIAMGLSMFVWALLILFTPWAVAMGVVAWLAWQRPYLQATLGRFLVMYGIVGAIASLPFTGDGGVGAAVAGAAIFGLAALVPGVLLLLAARSEDVTADSS